MEWLADPNAWIALVTLTALEIVLGIDNIIFLTILVGHPRQFPLLDSKAAFNDLQDSQAPEELAAA